MIDPKSALHSKLINLITHHIRRSVDLSISRHRDWNDVDKYTQLWQVEPKAVQRRYDSSLTDVGGVSVCGTGDHMKVTIPTSLAILDTFATYLSGSMLGKDFVTFVGNSPESQLGAALLQNMTNRNYQLFGNELALYTAWINTIKYGVGPMTLNPVTKVVNFPRVNPVVFDDGDTEYEIFREVLPTKEEVAFATGVQYRSISPWDYLPPYDVPVERVNEASFVGWFELTNYYKLLSHSRFTKQREGVSDLFNLKHIKESCNNTTDWVHKSYIYSRLKDQSRFTNHFEYDHKDNPPVIVAWVYVEIIPKAYGLGSSKYPEKWLFGVANESIIIKATPLDDTNNQLPMAVGATEIDGESSLPLSRLLFVSPFQKLIDFVFNAHILAIRQNLNGTYLADPSIVNVNDLTNPEPGKIIRIRKPAFGSGRLSDSILPLRSDPNVLRENFTQINFLSGLAQDNSGASDALQGLIPARTSRISAAEITTAAKAASYKMGRVEAMLKRTLHTSLGELTAYLFQNTYPDDFQVKIQDDFVRRFIEDYNIVPDSSKMIDAQLGDIVVPFEVMAVPDYSANEDISTWLELIKLSGANQALASSLDYKALVNHIARLAGVKSFSDIAFLKNTPTQQAGMISPDQLSILQQQGAAAPLPT